MSDPDGLSGDELLAALAERDAVIAALLVEIEQLKRRVGMDSSNSSMPPGSDGPAARAKRAKARKKKPSPRARGGQAGHGGHNLQRVANPDRVEVVAPQCCDGCGQGLAGPAGVAGRVVSRVQVFDTPPVKLEVTEYQMLAVPCGQCGVVTRAAAPDGVAGPCCYGPNVRAATALWACNGHMSIERAADLMGVLLDAPVSTGFTGGLVARAEVHRHLGRGPQPHLSLLHLFLTGPLWQPRLRRTTPARQRTRSSGPGRAAAPVRRH